MVVSRKLPIVNHVPPSADEPAFLIIQDKLNQVYIVASGALGAPVSLDPDYNSNANATISALNQIKAEAHYQPVLNVEFAALIDQADALIRVAGNARASIAAQKRKRPRK
ncbi:MAG TPA: hypothetical protein VNX86_08080 [Rhizomicrobium sp.]|nr:hypothetical protein [Rhizomicrobium sp.]